MGEIRFCTFGHISIYQNNFWKSVFINGHQAMFGIERNQLKSVDISSKTAEVESIWLESVCSAILVRRACFFQTSEARKSILNKCANRVKSVPCAHVTLIPAESFHDRIAISYFYVLKLSFREVSKSTPETLLNSRSFHWWCGSFTVDLTLSF